jgi:hypothetical protein
LALLTPLASLDMCFLTGIAENKGEFSSDSDSLLPKKTRAAHSLHQIELFRIIFPSASFAAFLDQRCFCGYITDQAFCGGND